MDRRGTVAVILAATVGTGWAVALVVSVIHADELTTGGAVLLYTLGGTLVGGLIGWLGTAGRREDQDK